MHKQVYLFENQPCVSFWHERVNSQVSWRIRLSLFLLFPSWHREMRSSARYLLPGTKPGDESPLTMRLEPQSQCHRSLNLGVFLLSRHPYTYGSLSQKPRNRVCATHNRVWVCAPLFAVVHQRSIYTKCKMRCCVKPFCVQMHATFPTLKIFVFHGWPIHTNPR
jgi:hypothetical protein